MNNQEPFARALRILGLLEQIGGTLIILITLAIMLPGLPNKNAIAMLALGIAGGTFLISIGSMLIKYSRMAWMATIAMCVMSAALNLVYFNVFGLIIPAIYLFFLLHPKSRALVQ